MTKPVNIVKQEFEDAVINDINKALGETHILIILQSLEEITNLISRKALEVKEREIKEWKEYNENKENEE